MKHYYDDDGHLNFDQNRDLLVDLGRAYLPRWPAAPEQYPQIRLEALLIADTLMHCYQVTEALAGAGDCALAEWGLKSSEDPCENVLRAMLVDFVERGYVVREFRMAAYDAMCEIQFTYLLSRP